MLQTCYVDENHHFLTYSAKNPAKIPCFYDFLAKMWFFANFHVYFQCIKIQNFWGPADFIMSQWHHMKFNGTLVSMDRGGQYQYTGSKYRGIRHSLQKIQGGVATPSPFGGHVTKNTSGGQGLMYRPVYRYSQAQHLESLVSSSYVQVILCLHVTICVLYYASPMHYIMRDCKLPPRPFSSKGYNFFTDSTKWTAV